MLQRLRASPELGVPQAPKLSDHQALARAGCVSAELERARFLRAACVHGLTLSTAGVYEAQVLTGGVM